MTYVVGSLASARPRCGSCEGCRWGGACRNTYGRLDPLTDLHEGKGTRWLRRPDGTYYPDCDCHGPEARDG